MVHFQKRGIYLALIVISMACTSLSIKSQDYPFVGWKTTQTNVLKNSNYEATVYYSSSTGHKAKYNLIVTVSDDRIVTIHFGNEGSVHTGYNNEGYLYSGGELKFSINQQGEITGASTIVHVRYSNGTVQKFSIEL